MKKNLEYRYENLSDSLIEYVNQNEAELIKRFMSKDVVQELGFNAGQYRFGFYEHLIKLKDSDGKEYIGTEINCNIILKGKDYKSLYTDYITSAGYCLQRGFPVAILILLSGVGISREDDAVRYVRMKNRTQLSLVNLFSAFTAVVLFSVAFMLAAVIYFRISQGLTLENFWLPAIKNGPAQSFPVPTVVAHFSPVGAVLLKLLYEIIYATFLAIVSMTVNPCANSRWEVSFAR